MRTSFARFSKFVFLATSALSAPAALAQATPTSPDKPATDKPATDKPATDKAAADNEIVVTAQKRSENLQDVPISIQALGAAKLEEHQVTSFDDYAKLLPSVSFQSFGPGQSQI
ncbi:MAG: TonB-dependent receptor, partial [Croceibacterium sp.]